MGKKKPSKAKKRVRALKQAEPTAVISDETDWAQFEPEELKSAPHSFVIYRGKVGRYMKELMKDIRKVMEPYTASNLQMKKGNVLKDYVSIASYFHVTHLSILTRTQVSPYLKICKIPRGPTLTFRILNYTLSRDVLSSLKKQVTSEAQFLHQPLLIMNNFSSESKTLDLVSKTFQNMFPSINVTKIRLSEIRRVLLLNYIEEDDTIQLRHYTITYKTTGVSRGLKKVLRTKNGKIPNLGRCTDIADFLNRDGDMSESEAEDNTETVEISQKMGVKVSKGLEEVGIKLVELGPRIQMQLIKVEEGLCEGEVLYHKNVDKTAEEKLFIRQQRNLKKKLKMSRKREQDLNVEKKKKDKEDHRKKCLRGMGTLEDQPGNGNAEVMDDDAEWYRKEVGEEPDEDTFEKRRPESVELNTGRKRKFDDKDLSFKPKVSKFAKVKEKAKLLKKQKQLGIVGKKLKVNLESDSGGFRRRSDGDGRGAGMSSRRGRGSPGRSGGFSEGNRDGSSFRGRSPRGDGSPFRGGRSFRGGSGRPSRGDGPPFRSGRGRSSRGDGSSFRGGRGRSPRGDSRSFRGGSGRPSRGDGPSFRGGRGRSSRGDGPSFRGGRGRSPRGDSRSFRGGSRPPRGDGRSFRGGSRPPRGDGRSFRGGSGMGRGGRGMGRGGRGMGRGGSRGGFRS